MEVKNTADGTKFDHNKQDIDDLNKETKALSADGGSEDGCREQGNVGMIRGELNACNDKDKVRQVVTKMKVTKMWTTSRTGPRRR